MDSHLSLMRTIESTQTTSNRKPLETNESRQRKGTFHRSSYLLRCRQKVDGFQCFSSSGEGRNPPSHRGSFKLRLRLRSSTLPFSPRRRTNTSSLAIGRQDKMTQPSGKPDGRLDAELSTPCPISDSRSAAKQVCATLATLQLPLAELARSTHTQLCLSGAVSPTSHDRVASGNLFSSADRASTAFTLLRHPSL